MRFRQTDMEGVLLIDLERVHDNRGFFVRTWCRREFADAGIAHDFVQSNVSYNARRGTLRGMHYQDPPHGEAKLVRCSRGALCDVIIDLRPGSSTYLKWLSLELSSCAMTMLYIPEGFAHGFLTLADDTEVAYFMSEYYLPEYQRGIRWDDPAFAISWPEDVRVISAKDESYPDFTRRSLEVHAS